MFSSDENIYINFEDRNITVNLVVEVNAERVARSWREVRSGKLRVYLLNK